MAFLISVLQNSAEGLNRKAFIKKPFVISTIFDCQLSFDKSTSSVYVMYKCILQVLLDNILSKFCLFLLPSSYPSIRGGQGIFTTARFVDERASHGLGRLSSPFKHTWSDGLTED